MHYVYLTLTCPTVDPNIQIMRTIASTNSTVLTQKYVKALLHYALTHLRFYFSRVSLAFSLAFLIPTCWYPKRERKREKNARKIKNASPTRDNVSLLHYALGKNASQVAFWSRFGRVLVMFWSRFGHKHCQNANPTHSVIRPLDSCPSHPMF